MATYSRRDLIEKINSIAEFCGYNEVVQIFCDNGLLSLEMIEEIEVKDNIDSTKLYILNLSKLNLCLGLKTLEAKIFVKKKIDMWIQDGGREIEYWVTISKLLTLRRLWFPRIYSYLKTQKIVGTMETWKKIKIGKPENQKRWRMESEKFRPAQWKVGELKNQSLKNAENFRKSRVKTNARGVPD